MSVIRKGSKQVRLYWSPLGLTKSVGKGVICLGHFETNLSLTGLVLSSLTPEVVGTLR